MSGQVYATVRIRLRVDRWIDHKLFRAGKVIERYKPCAEAMIRAGIAEPVRKEFVHIDYVAHDAKQEPH